MKLFVNDLTVMDFSYLCPQRGMVGESWIVDVVLDGGLNEESMIQDFGIVKKQLKRIIDDHVDHKLVVPADYKGTRIFHDESNQDVEVLFTVNQAEKSAIYLKCPSEAYAFVYCENIDKPSVVAYLKDIIATHLPENVHGVELLLREEVIDSPFYHYTHGLKKHDGNCQRIAHGHRSKIIIFKDGVRVQALESKWSQQWKDIYIGSKEDLVEAAALISPINSKFIDDDAHYCFQYESSQGLFSLAMPKKMTDLIAYDSTVECIAQHVFESLKSEYDATFEVHAFEGVGKGAIVSDA